MISQTISISHPSELICHYFGKHNLLNYIILALMNLGGATLHTEHRRTLARKDEVRPLFTMRALGQWHGALPYLPDILFVS